MSIARLKLAAIALGTLLLTPSDAWAYIDPGTGSYLFQLAAAGFLAGLYMIQRYWHSLTTVFRGRRTRLREAGEGAQQNRNGVE